MCYYIAPVNHRPTWSFAPISRNSQQVETSRNTRFMPVDVIEKQDRFIISALVPGLLAEDINISLEKEVITIEGSLAYSREDGAEYLVAERPSGSFKRSFRLPSLVDAEKIDAKLVNGVLTVEIQKAEKAMPKTIKVN